MQKFGLQRNRSSQYSAIELQIAKEQASALGRAGRKLRLSLERYQKAIDDDLIQGQRDGLLSEISNNVWELMLQREFIGFVEGNLKWVKDNYLIPEDAFRTLGKKTVD